MRTGGFSAVVSCLVLASCAPASTRTVKVIKYVPGYYAEWGERDGEAFEDRYDAVVCEVYSGKKHVRDIAVYQHWFKQNGKDFPAVGSLIQIESFPSTSPSSLGIPDTYTIELDDFEKLRARPSDDVRPPNAP